MCQVLGLNTVIWQDTVPLCCPYLPTVGDGQGEARGICQYAGHIICQRLHMLEAPASDRQAGKGSVSNLKSSLGHSTRVGSHHFSPPAALGIAGGFFFFSCACCCNAACIHQGQLHTYLERKAQHEVHIIFPHRICCAIRNACSGSKPLLKRMISFD